MGEELPDLLSGYAVTHQCGDFVIRDPRTPNDWLTAPNSGVHLNMFPGFQQRRDLSALNVERRENFDKLMNDDVAPPPNQVDGMIPVG